MHISCSILILWGSTGILFALFMVPKTPDLPYNDSLCNLSVQPLSQTSPFNTCLFKVCRLCSDWSAPESCPSTDLWQLKGYINNQKFANLALRAGWTWAFDSQGDFLRMFTSSFGSLTTFNRDIITAWKYLKPQKARYVPFNKLGKLLHELQGALKHTTV